VPVVHRAQAANRTAEVRQVHAAALVQQHCLWRNMPMDQALNVKYLDCLQQLECDVLLLVLVEHFGLDRELQVGFLVFGDEVEPRQLGVRRDLQELRGVAALADKTQDQDLMAVVRSIQALSYLLEGADIVFQLAELELLDRDWLVRCAADRLPDETRVVEADLLDEVVLGEDLLVDDQLFLEHRACYLQ